MPRNLPPRPIALIFQHFADLQDPRIERTKVHSLEAILVISICAVLCGASGWDDIALFGRCRRRFFSSLLARSGATPSADTFRRLFERLEPSAFEQCFRRWVQALGRTFQDDVLACDGKSVKRAVQAARPTVPLHLMHVGSTKQGILLGQRVVDGASGQVAGRVEMLALLDLRGATLTTDANSCAAKVTRAVRQAGPPTSLRSRATAASSTTSRCAASPRPKPKAGARGPALKSGAAAPVVPNIGSFASWSRRSGRCPQAASGPTCTAWCLWSGPGSSKASPPRS